MHTLHIVAVDTCTEDGDQDAIALVQQFLDSDGPRWWDWYEIGGRWDGHFGQCFPETGTSNVLSLRRHPTQFRAALQAAGLQQNEAFLNHRDSLTGATVRHLDGVDGHLLGEPVASDAYRADALTRANQGTQQAWASLMAAQDLPSVSQQMTHGLLMATYAADRVNDLVMGNWCPDSYFYSYDYGSANAAAYLSDWDSHTNRQEGTDTCLVAVDFHF